MGYGMSQATSQFRIPRGKHKDALAAIKALTGERFSWVSSFSDAVTLGEALEVWRWEPSLDADYNIDGIDFTGEKLGDEDTLFKALAPFVDSGSMIEMCGEDGDRWRWVFKNGTMREVKARIVWGAS